MSNNRNIADLGNNTRIINVKDFGAVGDAVIAADCSTKL